nr:MAG TPA_asm: hypothetical protein [Caudoviricetes sp.]
MVLLNMVKIYFLGRHHEQLALIFNVFYKTLIIKLTNNVERIYNYSKI